MNPFIDIVYSGNTQTYTVKPVYQYDHGYILRLSGIDESSIVQIHYAIPGMRGAIQDFAAYEGLVWTSKIPNSLLAQPREIQIFAYITSEEMGQTILKVIIPIIERPRPADYAYTEDELRGLEYVLSELNTAMNLVGELNEKTVAAAAAATDAANAANSVANIKVSASSIDHQQTAWAAVETENGVKHIRFGIPKGEPGVSVTHKWDGSILTFTSASGTTSIDLGGISSGGGEGGGSALPPGGATGQMLVINEDGEAVWTTLTPDSIGAQPKGTYLTEESDPNIPEWARASERPKYTAEDVGALPVTYVPPNQTAEQVGADPVGTAQSLVSSHNTNTESHNDLRLALKELAERLDAFFDADDKTLDELSELIAYIKNNKTLIDGITTSKVSVSDIVDNLTTNLANRPLSAAQGVALKALIDAIKIPTALSELSADATHRLVTDAEKTAWNAKSNFSGAYNDLTGKPTIPTVPTNISAFQNDVGYLTKHQDISGKLDANKLPEAIEDALGQAKASGEFDGKDGEPGTSPTVATSKSGKVTTVTFTDKNGSKTATINDGTDGSPGDPGFSPTIQTSKSGKVTTITLTDKDGKKTVTINDGADGQPGSPGTSVTVSNVSTSNADGGSNVVTFSDGKTLTVKNGNKGSQGEPGKDASVTSANIQSALGYKPASEASVSQLSEKIAGKVGTTELNNAVNSALTEAKNSGAFKGDKGDKGDPGKNPVKGTDYWTGADQESIIQRVIAALGTPVFGTVDENNNIILTGELAEGTYTVKYEDAEGNQSLIGSLTTDGLPEEPTYTNVLKTSIDKDGSAYNGGKGYKVGYRYSSSGGGDVSASGIYTSGYLYVPANETTFYLQNVTMNKDDSTGNGCNVYFFTNGIAQASSGSMVKTSITGAVWDDAGNLKQFYIGGIKGAYIKLNTAYLGDDSIITCNEPIE